jgi:hypothetical protein
VTEQRVQRRLAAILAADVVGYSALMQRAEPRFECPATLRASEPALEIAIVPFGSIHPVLTGDAQ